MIYVLWDLAKVFDRKIGGSHAQRCRIRFLALVVAGAAIAAAYQRSKVEAMIFDAANRFIDSLTAEQKKTTLLPFNGKDRTMWQYFRERGFKEQYGRDRHGITFKEMNLTQRFMAQSLMSAGVSQAGYIKAMKVLTMEDVVRSEKGNRRVLRQVLA